MRNIETEYIILIRTIDNQILKLLPIYLDVFYIK